MPLEPRGDARLIALLRRETAPRDTKSLADRLRLHPNGVRDRLRVLETRGLVVRGNEQGATGRPRDVWSLAPKAIAATDRPLTGWAMARSLARAIPATRAGLEQVEAAGVDMGLELACQVGLDPADGPVGELGRALEALGFEPERDADGADVRYRLMTCPYADVVRESPAVVCSLHRGVVRGVLACIDADAEVTAFEPHDPDVAGCVVAVRLGDAQAQDAGGAADARG